MKSKMVVLIYFLIMLFFLIKANKTQNQIKITLNSKKTHYLFCDDYLSYFGTSNITIHKLIGDQEIDISNKISKNVNNSDNICKNRIDYSTELKNEIIKIVFKTFPKNLHNLFRQSTINSIEIINDIIYEKLNFSNMFRDCLELTSIDLSNFIFCNVGTFNLMLSGCKNLKYFSLPTNLPNDCNNFINATFIGMFYGCSSLTSIDLSYVKLNGDIRDIKDIFMGCDNIESIKLKGILISQIFCHTIYGLSLCIDDKVKVFPEINNLKNLELFDLDVSLYSLGLNSSNSLEECLYYKYYRNIKICKKYIGFHYCGECINNNTEYYCTKNIEGQSFNFYYLENQKNENISKRECYWSNNYNDFLSYTFINNSENGISYYINKICEIYFGETNKCFKCNNYYGYYKIENEDYTILF